MNTKVEVVMSRSVVTVNPDTPVMDVVKALDENQISAVPVVSADRVVGVLSEGDLILKVAHSDMKMARYWRAMLNGSSNDAARQLAADLDRAVGQTARDLMTAPAITIDPKATIAEAARMMHARHLKRLPVVDESGRLVGIVSRSDLIKAMAEATPA